MTSNSEDIYSHVYLKFFSRFIRDGMFIEELKEDKVANKDNQSY